MALKSVVWACFCLVLFILHIGVNAQKKETVILRDTLDSLQKLSENIYTVHSVSSGSLQAVIKALKPAGRVFSVLGDIVHLEQKLFSDENHHETYIQQLKEVYRGIESVKLDINQLAKALRWNDTKLNFQNDMSAPIQSAKDYLDILQNGMKGDKDDFHTNQLMELCDHRKCEVKLNFLYYEFIAGNPLKTGILKSLYDVSRGNRPLLVKFCAQFLPLLYVATLAVLADANLNKLNPIGMADMVQRYEVKWNKTIKAADDILRKASEEAPKNMNNDVKDILLGKKQQPKETLTGKIWNESSKKYDWLNIIIALYDGTAGSDDIALPKKNKISGKGDTNAYAILYSHGESKGAKIHDSKIYEHVTKTCIDKTKNPLAIQKCIIEDLQKWKMPYADIFVASNDIEFCIAVNDEMKTHMVEATSNHFVAVVLTEHPPLAANINDPKVYTKCYEKRKLNACQKGVCQNGATCAAAHLSSTSTRSYTCTCAAGFTGLNCERSKGYMSNTRSTALIAVSVVSLVTGVSLTVVGCCICRRQRRQRRHMLYY